MVPGAGAPSRPIDLGTVAVLSNPLRYAFDEASKAATQFSVGDPGKPPVAEDDEPGLEGRDFYSPERSTFASGMHAVIVETDPETAEIRILKYAVVHDCGHLINPMIVEGQIHGGVAQGVGGALYERMAYDESGQLLNASFMDFLMPYVTEVPDAHRDRPPRDAVAAEPARHQGRGRGGRDPVGGRLRRRDRGRRGLRDHRHADLAVGAVRPAASSTDRGDPMKFTGENTLPPPSSRSGTRCSTRRSWSARSRAASGWRRTGENAYAMTVTAGVAAIKGTYAGSCVLSDLVPHESLTMRLAGRRRPRHDRRDGARALRARPTGATTITYDADAVVGGMVGGVGQRMLTLGVAADGRRVLRQRRRDVLSGAAGAGRRRRRAAAASEAAPCRACSPHRPAGPGRLPATTSSRASPSAPAWCCSACSLGRRR